MYKQYRVILACFMLVWIECYTANAQIDTLRHAADVREQYFRSFRLVWSVKTTYIFTPSRPDPQAERQAIESVLRQMQARGVKDVATVRKQLESDFEQQRRHHARVMQGDCEVEWGKDDEGKELLFVSGVSPLFDDNLQVRGQQFYGEGWGMLIYIPPPGMPPPWPEVWCCTGHCSRYPSQSSRGLDIGTDELSVVACLNVLRINEGAGWEVVGQTKDSVHVRKRDYLDEYGVFEMDVVLDVRRGGIPSRILKRNTFYEGEIRVTGYTRSGGQWLPQSVKSVFRTHKQFPGMTRERTWHLRGVQPKRGVTFESISAALQAVGQKDIPIVDLRAIGCNLTVDDIRRTTGDDYVLYEWKGRLPTIDKVKEMLAARRQRKQAPTSGFLLGAWRFIPPLLLITVGALWYWRLRKGAGRKG